MPASLRVLWTRCRMFSVMHTAVNASTAAAWLRLPASSGRSPSIRSTSSSVASRASVVVGADQHVGQQAGVEVLHLRRRQVMEGGRHPRRRQRRLDRRGHRAAGRDDGQHLPALLHERVDHRDDDLAGQRLGQSPDGGDRAFPRGGDDDEIGGGRAGVVDAADRAGQPPGPRPGHLGGQRHRPVGIARADRHPQAGRSQPYGQSPAGRTGPSKHAYVHWLTVTRGRPRRQPATPSRTVHQAKTANRQATGRYRWRGDRRPRGPATRRPADAPGDPVRPDSSASQS